jgi:hypothetical protein
MQNDILYETTTTKIFALSETEVGKVIIPLKYQWVDVVTNEPIEGLDFYQPTCEAEIRHLQYANLVNDLFPKFLRKESWQDVNGKTHDMLVMQRIYPLEHYHFDRAQRVEMLAVFVEKLKELHKMGFIHGDLMRPTNYYTRTNYRWMFANIVQTQKGLRLLDAGFSQIITKDEIKQWTYRQHDEEHSLSCFEEYYLSETLNKKPQESN